MSKIDFSWEHSPFDTKIFGFPVAKIKNIKPGNVASLVTDLKKNKVLYATYRLPANSLSLIHELERAGFIVVDGLISLSIDLKEVTLSPIEKNIREAKREDIPELRRIARGAFLLNRFYNDSLIPKDKAPLVYEKWIENSVLGKKADKVLLFEEGEIAGFITLEKKDLTAGRQGRIPLVAVSKDFQGKGIAKKLINTAFNKYRRWGVKEIKISTAMFNIPAIRLYQSCGFKVANSHLTFRWANL